MKFRKTVCAALVIAALTGSTTQAAFVLPKDLTRVDDRAFENSSITDVVLPEGVLSVGSRAFAESELSSIRLPSTVESIAKDAFEGCEGLVVDASATEYGIQYCEEQGLLIAGREREIVLSYCDGTSKAETVICPTGETVRLPKMTVKRNGYSFDGWNTEPDGSGTSYADGAEVIGDTLEPLQLYGQWSYTETPERRNARMLDTLSQSNVLGAKKESILLIGKVLFDAGYEPAFIAGIMANIYAEGSCGYFENSNYVSNPEKKPSYLVYMDENWDYGTKYAKHYVYDDSISLRELKKMHDALAAAGYPGKFGLGCVQWTGSRCATLLNCYLAEANGADHITKEQTCIAEGKMLLKELEGGYKSVLTAWKTANPGDRNTQEAAYSAGYTVCMKYEKPAGGEASAIKRGERAMLIYAVMEADNPGFDVMREYAVTSGNVRVRSTPSIDGEELGILYVDTVVRLSNAVMMDDRGVLWYYIEYEGLKGWCSSKYLIIGGLT